MHDDPDKRLYVPENVYVIGTMNDIDRSVDTFDFAMARVLASGGIEPGTLVLTGDPEVDSRVRRALDLLEDIGQDERHQTFLPEAELVAGVLLACGPATGSARRLCDPMCGHGGLLVRLHRTSGGTWPKMAATDVDAASVAITSIRLLVEGYRGGFENVRQADSLSSDDGLCTVKSQSTISASGFRQILHALRRRWHLTLL